eukprot:7380662-Prymnesium_polylepis.1
MEAMSNFVHSQLSGILSRMLDGEIVPKHVMFVADKENCNKFLWGGNGGANKVGREWEHHHRVPAVEKEGRRGGDELKRRG